MVTAFVAPREGSQRFMFNLTANVGLGSPNMQDDVELVQLGYFCIVENPNSTHNTPEMRALVNRMNPGDQCSGRADDVLVQIIKLHQRSWGGTQDGHVSVMRVAPGGSYGTHVFMLHNLLNNIRDANASTYPRIDHHPKCGPNLKPVVIQACSV